MRSVILVLVLIAMVQSMRAEADIGPEVSETKTTVKYKAAKDLNFEQLIIEGQLKRPELSVVTGEDDQGANGLLRLRESFLDRMTAESGGEIP